jgi:chloramphenicol-sensitive protein RarD
MTTLGLLNYIAPIMQFVFGLVLFHERMTPMRWLGFGLVWLALALFTFDSMHNRRRAVALERAAVTAAAV